MIPIDKIAFRAEVFSDLILSPGNQRIELTKRWGYTMLDPLISPIYFLLYDCWTLSVAMQNVKPENWSEVLDKVLLNVWEKNSKKIGKENFFKMAAKFFEELNSDLNCPPPPPPINGDGFKHRIGETVCIACFGEGHFGIDAVMYFDQLFPDMVKMMTESLKDLADNGFFADNPAADKTPQVPLDEK